MYDLPETEIGKVRVMTEKVRISQYKAQAIKLF